MTMDGTDLRLLGFFVSKLVGLCRHIQRQHVVLFIVGNLQTTVLRQSDNLNRTYQRSTIRRLLSNTHVPQCTR